jgi:hypothetical protein
MKIGEGVMEFWAASGCVPESREDRLLSKYGECLAQVKAAKELDCSPATVRGMLDDGRLERAGEGKVSTLSVARYLENPRAADYETRIRKQRKGAKFPILTPAKTVGTE